MPLLEPEGGARPDMDGPRPLEVPTEPKRSYLLDQLRALIRYVDEGGGVELHTRHRGDDRLHVTFKVYRSPHQKIAKEIRDERTGDQPWVWMPKRGLGRRRRPR